jgi:hypothetical protein
MRDGKRSRGRTNVRIAKSISLDLSVATDEKNKCLDCV